MAFFNFSFLSDYQNILGSIAQVSYIAILLMAVMKGVQVIFGWFKKNKELKKKQMSHLMTVQKIVNATVYFLGAIFILQAVGISITPLIASLGIGGLAVGLALQPTLSNYFAGLYISGNGFLQPDDYIQMEGGMTGYVVKVGWRSTLVRMWNNNMVLIPNSKLADSVITNFNEPQNKYTFVTPCGVSYNSNLKKVEKTALNVIGKIQKKKKYGVTDFEPCIRYFNFGDSNIDFNIVLQADSYSNHFLMKHEMIKDLKTAFDKEGIVISFPVRSIEFLDKPIEVQSRNAKV